MTTVHPERLLLVTTPIFYVNARPHLGHAYSMVLADAIARYEGARPSTRARLSTGTDEHGIKVHRAAEANGQSPAEWAASVAERFRGLANRLNIRYDYFIRTSADPAHRHNVQRVWQKLDANGLIYKGSFSGWYLATEERFVPESELASYKKGQLEYVSEENWMFRLSGFRERLLEWYRSSRPVHPEARLNDLTESLLKDDLPDLSISRPRHAMKWGIEVPGDGSHLVYVWLDALVSYLSVLEADSLKAEYSLVHVLGKDILKFHAVYWPAFLLGLGVGEEKLPRLVVHGHWRAQGEKMSKSTGNVIDPHDAINVFGSDALRWLLLKNSRLIADADYSPANFTSCYNSDLANGLGNLLSRVTSPKLRLDPAAGTALDRPFVDSMLERQERISDFYARHDFQSGLLRIVEIVNLLNGYVSDRRPWAMDDASSVQHTVLAVVRGIAGHLGPVMPTTAAMLAKTLDCGHYQGLQGLFPRIATADKAGVTPVGKYIQLQK